MSKKKDHAAERLEDLQRPAAELNPEESEEVRGGLLPAVQKVREAAVRSHLILPYIEQKNTLGGPDT